MLKAKDKHLIRTTMLGFLIFIALTSPIWVIMLVGVLFGKAGVCILIGLIAIIIFLVECLKGLYKLGALFIEEKTKRNE